jgi:hypothetical protein
MWIIPSWAVGVAFLIVVTGTVQTISRRITGRAGGRQGKDVAEESPRLAQALEEVQRRLGELEERVDFAERLLAKERDEARLAPPKSST